MTPVIAMRGVGRTYPGTPPVVAMSPADLTVEPGQYVTVHGPSGSGKSTFLHVAALLDRPSHGVYELDGVDVGALPESRRAALRGRRIGLVFQEHRLLPYRTAVENVALALLYAGVRCEARLTAARQALARVGLADRADALPATMSGGERQRVAIARALVHRPSLLLCDEPTGNLDPATAAEILTLLASLHERGTTLVVITHDRAVAARGERTVTMRDGILHD